MVKIKCNEQNVEEVREFLKEEVDKNDYNPDLSGIKLKKDCILMKGLYYGHYPILEDGKIVYVDDEDRGPGDIFRAIKEKYIDVYFDEHKKKRLGIDDAKRRGKIQEGQALSNLRKLKGIEILSGAKLSELEQNMAELKVCYSLTPQDLKSSPICPHCRFSLDDKTKNVAGQIEQMEDRIDLMVIEWTKMLLDTLSDPIILAQKKFLKDQEANAIDDFIKSEELPKRVDDFFVNSINSLLKGFEPVVIEMEDLMHKLEELPPMDEASFKAKINEIVAGYTEGKDTGKLRIVVKRRESED